MIGQEHFCAYLRSQIFPKYGLCAGLEANIIKFPYRSNSEKTND